MINVLLVVFIVLTDSVLPILLIIYLGKSVLYLCFLHTDFKNLFFIKFSSLVLENFKFCSCKTMSETNITSHDLIIR